MNQTELFGDDRRTIDALGVQLQSAKDAFEPSWKAGDDKQRLESYQTARDAIFRILTALGGEWQKVSDSHDVADFPTIAAIALLARQAENFAGVLNLHARAEAGKLLNELVQMGITTKTAVAMINMPKEQIDSLF